jgi:biotin carboxyl carrier protein
MKYEVQVTISSGQKTRTVELVRDAAGWRASLDGQPASADAVEISPGTISVLLDGQSFLISVTPAPDGKLKLQTSTHEFAGEIVDPRAWRGRRHGGVEAEGRQQVVAPMPGKVVRVLVKEGEQVEARQGLFVVEAMKMQNEIRSPKGGTVERVLVTADQAVNAGEVLCVIS